MKICVVTQSYYPVRSGVTEHVYHLSRELEKRGHSITVVTGRGRTIEDHGLTVRRIGQWVPLTLNGATNHVVVGFRFGRTLRLLQKREQFDLVHIHAPLDPFLPLAATENMAGPLVGTFHSYRPTNPLAALFPGRYRRAIERLSECIAVSPSAASFVTRYVDVSFTVIPNGIDTSRFSPAVEPFPALKDNTFTVLFVGRMDPRKGSKYLFQALPHLERELKEYRILVVGGGWRKKVYQQFIPLGLEHRVRFSGFASWDDLPRYYRSADVYCSPAVGGESFGIVLLEAMASELPIIASDIEGYRHVITHNREGLLCRPRNSRALAQRIVELARDPQRRSEMGREGRHTALGYDWKKIADQVVKIYEKVRE